MKTFALHLKKSLPPLLLTLAVNQAYAIEVFVTGSDGVVGLAGSAPGVHGTAGGTAADLVAQALSGTPLELVVYGGLGGRGGDGGARDGGTAGNGGNGGNGAFTGGTATVTANAGAAWAQSTVFGGRGGDAGTAGGANTDGEWANYPDYDTTFGLGGIAGNGGTAVSTARATAAGSGNADAYARAVGGNGGNSIGFAGQAGQGGNASATGYGQSDTGTVRVRAEAIGGISGEADFQRRAASTAGVAVTQVNAVSGNRRLEW